MSVHHLQPKSNKTHEQYYIKLHKNKPKNALSIQQSNVCLRTTKLAILSCNFIIPNKRRSKTFAHGCPYSLLSLNYFILQTIICHIYVIHSTSTRTTWFLYTYAKIHHITWASWENKMKYNENIFIFISISVQFMFFFCCVYLMKRMKGHWRRHKGTFFGHTAKFKEFLWRDEEFFVRVFGHKKFKFAF